MAKTILDGASLFSGQVDSAEHTALNAQDGDRLDVPQDAFVSGADIERDGMDLILTLDDGSSVTVEQYFMADQPPALVSPSGKVLTPNLVESFVQDADGDRYADAGGSMSDASHVGSIDEIDGQVSVTRTDGTTIEAELGTKIYEGDIVETSEEGAANIVFIDETSMAISEDARLAIDEYVFDPSTLDGSTDFSVLQGVFVYTSGIVGREDPDDVNIDTPVGSIGIRGTIIAGDINGGAEDSQITVIEGAIVVRNDLGEVTLSQQYETVRLGGIADDMRSQSVMEAQDVQQSYGAVSKVAANVFTSIQDNVQEQKQQQDSRPEGQKAGGEAAKEGQPEGEEDAAEMKDSREGASKNPEDAKNPGKQGAKEAQEELKDKLEAAKEDRDPVEVEAAKEKAQEQNKEDVKEQDQKQQQLQQQDGLQEQLEDTGEKQGLLDGARPHDAMLASGAARGAILSPTQAKAQLRAQKKAATDDQKDADKQAQDAQDQAEAKTQLEASSEASFDITPQIFTFTPPVTPLNIAALSDGVTHAGFNNVISVVSTGESLAILNHDGAAFQVYDLEDISVNPFLLTPLEATQLETQGSHAYAVGDVDADGHMDFLITAPFSGGTAGMTYLMDANSNTLIHESASGFLDGQYSAALGDINGDGYNDMLISLTAGNTDLKIVYGDDGLSSGNITNLASYGGGGITSTYMIDVAGLGDFDNDGVDDIGVLHRVGGTSDAVLDIHLGVYTNAPTATISNTIMGTTGFQITGLQFNTALQMASIGTFNSDGYDDLIVQKSAKSAVVIYGQDHGGGMETINTNGITTEGIMINTGRNIYSLDSVGDFNGDGYDDFAITVRDGDNYIINILYGGKTTDLESQDVYNLADLIADGEAGFAITHTSSHNITISGGSDQDGDGLADIIVGDGQNAIIFNGQNVNDKAVGLNSSGNSHANQDGDLLRGDSSDNTLNGGRHEKLSLLGGGGNDTLVLDVTDYGATASPFQQAFEGGEGNDTLHLFNSSGGATELINLVNVHSISSIGHIDMENGHSETLRLSYEQIFDMAEWNGTKYTLTIDADASADNVDIDWLSHAPARAVTGPPPAGYQAFTIGDTGNNVELYVTNSVVVNDV